MTLRLLLIVMICLPLAAPATGLDAVRPTAPPDPAGAEPSRQQDSVRLTRLTSGVLPPDGLLTVALGGRSYRSAELVDIDGTALLEGISHREVFLLVEAGLLPWLFVTADLPWRQWSDGVGWIPATGSGLGDGHWQFTAGRALGVRWLEGAVYGGGNLPVGDVGAGLGEGVFSPRAGLALSGRVWTRGQVPEMRIHLNLARTWNRNEADGIGTGTDIYQPWPPRYQPAVEAGGASRNDAVTFGAAVEFRKGTTSLWVEYSQDRFPGNETVSSQEQFASASAGLRWGVVEGWAAEIRYAVGLADDDESTAWWPGYPDWTMELAVAKQFSFGGSDRDGDGVKDRHDRCPDTPEDRDGFRDADGCPEYDNDLDGLPDLQDGAPDEPEDYDGFQDDDGIPDPDNDGDGIPDRRDLCPDVPEDFDGQHDDDGCPDDLSDRDGDGVADADDACPEEPEDRDGFEDEDGCPELDNDLDGIPDAEDACPDTAEDYDGDADQDGCPE